MSEICNGMRCKHLTKIESEVSVIEKTIEQVRVRLSQDDSAAWKWCKDTSKAFQEEINYLKSRVKQLEENSIFINRGVKK